MFEFTLACMGKGNYVCPPDAGPAWREAYEAGCDMEELEANLRLTPWERLLKHDKNSTSCLSSRRSWKKSGKDGISLNQNMSILVKPDTKVLVQGITGSFGARHAQLSIDYGSQVVAGVTPARAARSLSTAERESHFRTRSPRR